MTFKAASLLCLLAVSCREPAPHRVLPFSEYRVDPSCWGESSDSKNGTSVMVSFDGFMILTNEGDDYFPIFISKRCEFTEHGMNRIQSLFDNYRSLQFYGDNGLAKQEGLLAKNIGSNMRADIQSISPQSEVYSFTGEMSFDRNGAGSGEWKIIKINEMKRLRVDPFDFYFARTDDRMRMANFR